MDKILVNDQIISRSEAVIDIEDRGYQFGDGVYEVIRVYNKRLFTSEEHIERFYHSAEKIRIQIPYSKEDIIKWIKELVLENNIVDGSIYMQITRGAGMRNHLFPEADVTPVLTAYTREVSRPTLQLQTGVKAMIQDDIRWLRCDIKSLNLLPNLLAKQTAKDAGAYEAILHRNGTVTEGSSSNIFIVKNGQLQTHPATNLILNGITRQQIFLICDDNGVDYVERAFSLEELVQADEVFLTSTTSEIMPIIQIDDTIIGDGKPGIVTTKLQQYFEHTFQL